MSIQKLRPAVFLDRDGTINVEKNHLIDPADFKFIPGAPEALKRLQDAGFLLVLVTNQSGIGRGYFSFEQVDILHRHMDEQLKKYAVNLSGIYICPHHPTAGRGKYRQDCSCRKGQPGMLLQAAEELQIDLLQSYMVGDKEADIQAGQAAGCRSILVQTGYGKSYAESAQLAGVEIVADISSATDKILTERRS